MRHYRTALVLLATGALAAATIAPAQAGPLDRGGSGIIALSDAQEVPTAATFAGKLPGLKKQLCTVAKKPKAKKLSTKQALRSIDAFLAKRTSKKARKKFAKSKAYKKPAVAMQDAVTATAVGKPTAAVAALRRAHDRKRKSPTPLIALAPVLTDLGMPNEALALLAAAKKLKAPKKPPFGIPARAVLDNNVAYAQLALGKWKPAQKAAKAAVKRSPLLREASTNQALALLCTGKTKKAADMMFLGARRQGVTKKSKVMTPPPPRVQTRLPSVEVIQLDKGERPVIPNYIYRVPGKEVRPAFLAMQQDAIAAMVAAQQTVYDAAVRYAAHLKTLSPLTKRRTQDLVAAASGMMDPDLNAMWGVASRRQAELRDYWKVAPGGGDGLIKDCPGYHPALLSFDKAQRDYTSALYERLTAIAHELKAAPAYDLVMAQARLALAGNIVLLVGEGVQYAAVCDPNPLPAAGRGEVQNGTLQAGETGPCSDAPSSLGLSAKVVSVVIDCENFKLRIEGVSPWLNPFGYINKNVRTGELTIVAGVSVGANAGPLRIGGAGQGIYVPVGANGAVEVGIRTTAGVSAGGGGVSGGKSIDSDISIVGGITNLPSALGLRP